MIEEERSSELLDFYAGYTTAFQAAYERFASDANAVPDASDALPYYHAPCLFITPAGVEAYATESDLARHFESILRDMKSKRYLRTGLGEPQLIPLGPRCVLLSLSLARFDIDEKQYDEYGVTYTVVRVAGRWKVAVVNTHPKDAVLSAS